MSFEKSHGSNIWSVTFYALLRRCLGLHNNRYAHIVLELEECLPR